MGAIITVENLSKKFIISHEGKERYTALRDVVSRKAKNMLQVGRPRKALPSKEEFWALRDINFTIDQGDRVGIIGRNGAGKSTLLKVLSRITDPSTGRVLIRGRVASLLEVGTGFHPELTGRENIFLNGAILGMSRAEIRRKFDEIVDFAEVERFLDTPVKRYSSGMYVRLAFAVAAHLEPEILIVDEVLAVGDAQFQKKCLGKMEDVSKNEGRTVLFVSHNMNVIKSLCTKGILLSGGKVLDQGESNEVIKSYYNSIANTENNIYSHKVPSNELTITDILINNAKWPSFKLFQKITFTLSYLAKRFKGDCEFFILIYNDEGVCVEGIFQSDNQEYENIKTEVGTVSVEIENNFAPGRYYVSAGIFDKYKNFLDWVDMCEIFDVEAIFDDGRLFHQRLGLVIGNAKWQK